MSATFVTPYPPGFPVLVPGQLFTRQVLDFIRDLDTTEIHGYLPNFGYRVYTEKAIEIAGESAGAPTNGHRRAVRAAAPSPQKTPKKKSAKRGGFNGDQNLPEVGHDELLGQQQPGDALTATPPSDQGGVAEIVLEEHTDEQQPGDAVETRSS